MKKITLSLFALTASFIVNAQVDQLHVGETMMNSNRDAMDACDITVANDNLYGGAMEETRYASRFSVSQGEIFQSEKVTMIVGVVNDPTFEIDEDSEFMISIHETDAGAPGSEVTSVTITPTLSNFTETINVGEAQTPWDLYEIEIDLTALDAIAADESSDTDYFLAVGMTEDDGVQVGLNFTQGATGSITYLFDGDTSSWQVFNATSPDNISFTYSLEGDCTPLSTNDHLLSQVSVYPNPANDVINISLPASVEVVSATLFDILGKNTGVSLNNGAINISSLARGVYMLNIETNHGSITKKIMKR